MVYHFSFKLLFLFIDYDNEGNEMQDDQYYEDTDSEEDQEDPNSQRFISYKLVPEFLQANYIGSS